jgi:transcriptional regulator with XRE-family HTH domain
MNTAKLAKLLKSIANGKTAAALAQEMGIKAQNMRCYMRDEGVIPGTTAMQKMADYMGVGLDDLLSQLSDDESNGTGRKADRPAALSADGEIERLKKLPTAEKLRLARMLIDEAIVA